MVIGTDVADLFEELEPLVGTTSGGDDASSEKKGVLNTLVDFVSSIFMPVIPALSGAGMLKALLAYTEAQKLKCNPILAAGVAGIMIHPSWLAMVSAGEAVHFFGVIPFSLVGYASSVKSTNTCGRFGSFWIASSFLQKSTAQNFYALGCY